MDLIERIGATPHPSKFEKTWKTRAVEPEGGAARTGSQINCFQIASKQLNRTMHKI
jgi:hypothetical protein